MRAKCVKTNYLFVFWLLTATACQQQAAETAAPPATTSAPAVAAIAPTPTTAQRFSPLLSGYWVSADYLDDVARTRSPAKALAHLVAAPASLSIAPFATQHDSVQIGASYGMHEGGSLTLLLQADERATALPIKPDYGDAVGTFREISYRLADGDTLLLITSRNRKTSRLLHQLIYRRTGKAVISTDLETAVYRGVNKLLLARQYRGTDSLGQRVRVQFLLDGTVHGLPFKKYFIQTDFTGPNPGDEVVFDVYTKQQQELAASFGRDTLKLYTVRSDIGIAPGETDTTQFYIRGRLRYKLIPVKQP